LNRLPSVYDTDALPDVLQALKDEQNDEVKNQLQETIDFLSTF